MLTKGYAAAAVGDVTDQLTAEGKISDARFAQCVIKQRIASGYGPRRVRWELRSRGVADSIIKEHLPQLDDDWCALIVVLHQKRFGETPAKGYREQAREVRFFEARGFTLEQIRRALRYEL
ncbi:MAG: regulatory protein RecX [Gammaproteobacteria bacterium]